MAQRRYKTPHAAPPPHVHAGAAPHVAPLHTPPLVHAELRELNEGAPHIPPPPPIPDSQPLAGTEPLAVSQIPGAANGGAQHDDNPLKRHLEALQHAEAAARQQHHATADDVANYVDNHPELKQLSAHKRALIKRFPGLLAPAVAQLAAAHYQRWLAQGIPDDSEAMDSHIIAHVHADLEAMREQAARLQAAQSLNAALHVPPMPAPVPQPPRVPVSAPVSQNLAGGAGAGRNQITLTPEEREAAKFSFTDPKMSQAEKEYHYAMGKKRLAQAKARGEYQERG